jgi:hypothetical protein
MNKYVEAQNKWVAEVGLKVGDTVLIVCVTEGGEGATMTWVPSMDKFIGVEQPVTDIKSKNDFNGIQCGNRHERWWYPFCSLVKK